MKKLLLIIGIVIVCTSCQSEPQNNYPKYYRAYNQTLKLEKAGNFQEAINYFQKAEILVDFVPPDHLIKARKLALDVKNCELAKLYFQKAVNNGFEFYEFNFSSEVCPELDNTSVTAIGYDTHYRNAVIEMFEEDQAARIGASSEKPMQEIDSLNIHKLLSLIEKNGYPNPKIIGNRAAGYAFIIMLHFDSDINNKRLKPIIDHAFKKGLIDPSQYAWIIDRRKNWGPDKLDPYYYQLPISKYFDLTEEKIAEIDQRRDSIGLKPLSEMNISRTENGGISIQM